MTVPNSLSRHPITRRTLVAASLATVAICVALLLLVSHFRVPHYDWLGVAGYIQRYPADEAEVLYHNYLKAARQRPGPDTVACSHSLSDMYVMEGNYGKACQYALEASNADPSDKRTLCWAVYLCAIAGHTREVNEPQDLLVTSFVEVARLYSEKQYAECASAAKKLIDEAPPPDQWLERANWMHLLILQTYVLWSRCTLMQAQVESSWQYHEFMYPYWHAYRRANLSYSEMIVDNAKVLIPLAQRNHRPDLVSELTQSLRVIVRAYSFFHSKDLANYIDEVESTLSEAPKSP